MLAADRAGVFEFAHGQVKHFTFSSHRQWSFCAFSIEWGGLGFFMIEFVRHFKKSVSAA
jgi:hypothetical protein